MRLPLVVLALLAVFPAAASADVCARSRDLHPGRSAHGFFRTVAPFEHFGASRTLLFPHTCSTRALGRGRVLRRTSLDRFPTPYISVTRTRRQLFLYGYGSDAATEGGFVAAVDPRTLRRRWITRIPDRRPLGQWSYPGVLLAHGNGRLYAVYGNVLVRLDARTGDVLRRRELPEDPNGTGAAYNGMVVMPDGRIVTKRIERGPCDAPALRAGVNAAPGALAGLTCATRNALPTVMVVVDPGDLSIRSTVVPPEPVTGRITAGRVAGRDYVFAAGRDTLRRFRYAGGRLRLDRTWGPVTYRTGAQTPGTGPGVLGHFLVVQTNFLPSPEPMTVTAVDLRDDRRVFRARPFGAPSLQVSKAALDPATMTVVTHDASAHEMAALRLDPRRGFHVRWRRDVTSLAFSALVGPRRDREVVIPDAQGGGERVTWRSERTGALHARSAVLSRTPAPGNIVTPGFGGRFYYTSGDGTLVELRPRGARSPGAAPSR